MFSSSIINLIMIAVMSAQSLFGVSFHALHEGCCQGVVRQGDHQENGSCVCHRCSVCLPAYAQGQKCGGKKTHNHHTDEKENSQLAEHACQIPSSQAPLGFPCDCQCQEEGLVFLQSSAKPHWVNRFSFEPADSHFAFVDFSMQVSMSHLFFKRQKNNEAGWLDSCCAVTQVWRL